MSGYLDDEGHSSSSSRLLEQLQQQSYSRRIPSNDRNKRWYDTSNKNDADNDDDDGLSITTWDSEEEQRRAQQEWEESIKQLNLAFQIMVLPFFGKWLGRKWSYWAMTRFQQHGFSTSHFGLSWLWAPTSIISDSAVAALQP